MLGQDMSG